MEFYFGAGDKGKFLDVYLPQAVWYDWFTLDYVLDGESPMSISNLPTPLDHVPVSIFMYVSSVCLCASVSMFRCCAW